MATDEEIFGFRLSNGDILYDTIENHRALLIVNGLSIDGCLKTGRLFKKIKK